MAISELKFTKDWNNAEDFPVAAKDAATARANIQQLHDETKDYINTELVPAVEAANNITKHCWRVRDFDMVTGEAGYHFRYLYSDNRTAYPDSGVVDGFEYEYIGIPANFATPPGGAAGQVLTKVSDADHDFMWAYLSGGSGDGTGVGGAGGAGAVRYDIEQALGSSQKAMARKNIGAASQTLAITVEGLIQDVGDGFEGLRLQVADATGKVTKLEADVNEIKMAAGDGDSNEAELGAKFDEVWAQVRSNEDNIGRLSLRSDEFGVELKDATGAVSKLEQTVKDITLYVSDPIGGEGHRYVSITLTVDGVEHTGTVLIDGNVDISGQLSAEALYATLGDIARLKVDSLSTSRRIPMYLGKNTSDDNYIDIEDQHFALRRAWVKRDSYGNPLTEQAVNDFGSPLFWERDITSCTFGADGYPRVAGARVFTTTKSTSWPVMVYQYDSGDRVRLFFEESANFAPRMVWGEGYGDQADLDRGKGFIQKLGAEMEVLLKTSKGKYNGVKIGDEYTDLMGMRQTSVIDLSQVPNNKLYEKVDGYETMHSWTLQRDENNRPIRVENDQDGHVCEVRWWD